MEFRNLKEDEIEVRVQSVKLNQDKTPKGVVLLLYKNARCDMNILDETVGPESWQNRFYELCDNLFCSVGINVNYKDRHLPAEWIWKDDSGIEGNAGEIKSTSSDARKRAGFVWGIGRELYTSPFIWVPATKCNINNGRCNDRFEVEKIVIEDKKIKAISIINTSIKSDAIKDKRCFIWQA